MKPSEYLDRKFASGKIRKCWMCGCVLTRGTASADHLVAKSRGGKDAAANYRLACKPCNSSRGNTPLPKRKRLALVGQAQKKPRDLSALIAAIKSQRKS